MDEIEYINFIKINYKRMSLKDMSILLKCKLNFLESVIRKNSFLKEEIINYRVEFIKQYYLTHTKEYLAKKLYCSKSTIDRLVYKYKLHKLKVTLVTSLEGEIWKRMVNEKCSNYWISNKGRVKNYKEQLIKYYIPKNGYPLYRLFTDYKEFKSFLLHRLVALYFIPNDDPINKTEVDHIDANKLNFQLENLQWLTPKDNTKKAINMGLCKNKPRGENHPHNKYTEKEIRIICELLEQKKTYKEILDIYPKYNKSLLQTIKCRYNWKEVSKDYNF